MNCIDLFAGAGGLSEGFIREKFNVLAHVEMDSAACLTLKTRVAYHYLKRNRKLDIYKKYLRNELSSEEFYKNIPNRVLDSVINKEINENTINDIFLSIDKIIRNKNIDIIIGGPPCQAYSIAGRSRDPNRMKNDKRNYLYKYYIKFLEKYKPKIFVFENVLGLLSAQQGKVFKNMQREFKKLGYNIEYNILDASDFGVLQKRKRVILIGWDKKLNFKYPKFEYVSQTYTIKHLFEDLPDIKSGEMYSGLTYAKESNACLKRTKIRNDWDILTQHIARPNNENDLKIYKLYVETWNNKGKKLRYNELPDEFIKHKNKESFLDRFNIVSYEGISHTIVAHISKDGHYYIHPDIYQNRSISVREAARIQSFPDDYYFENSRTAAFRQIGNAVPPLMAQMIAKQILIAMKE